MTRRQTVVCGLSLVAVVALALVLLGTLRANSYTGLTTPHQAVFLINGQVFFGKLEKLGSPFPILTDVYYVQSQVNQETKQVKNVLVKRGSEWHAPDRMILNANQILFIASVKPDSTVEKFIEELKAR